MAARSQGSFGARGRTRLLRKARTMLARVPSCLALTLLVACSAAPQEAPPVALPPPTVA